jgi:ABC-type sugar transport system ATPase subunit
MPLTPPDRPADDTSTINKEGTWPMGHRREQSEEGEEGAVIASQPPSTIIRMDGIVKRYPGTLALAGVDFDVQRGEIHALLGENGAGKSTLIKCLAGVVRPDDGNIEVMGKSTGFLDAHTARSLGIVVIHQNSNLVPDLTVAENLVLGDGFPKRAGIFLDSRRLLAEARLLLQRVGLPESLAGRNVAELQPHESAMVSIARAIRTDAKVIVMDEPTTALSHSEVRILFAQIRSLAADGVGFVYVSHRLAEVFEIADRLTVLRNGRRTGTFDRHEANRQQIIDAIIGDERSLIAKRGVPHHDGTVRLRVRDLRVGNMVRGIDFDVHAGEVVGIAGLTGSGAEEAVSTLFASPAPTGGTIELDDQRIEATSPAACKRAGIAFVPKDRHAEALLPGRSVKENLTVPSTAVLRNDPVTRWLRQDRETEMAERIVGELHIKAPSIDAPIDALSGGNQQKCVIGRWFVENYSLYLFVDPCAGVDIHSKSEIYDLVRRAAERGAAVVFTSTEIEEYARVCDRVLVLSVGRVVGELGGADLDENEIVRLALSDGDVVTDGQLPVGATS